MTTSAFRFFFTLGIGLFSLLTGWGQASKSSPNVVFIAVDDLRPELNCYGASHIHSPNLDRFAQQGRMFYQHYVQVPTCGASRFSMLRGKRPTLAAHLGNQAIRDYAEDEQPYESMAHLFRKSGYRTVALGKVGHYVDGKVYSYEGEGDGHLEMPRSWDTIWGPVGKWKTAWNGFFGYADGSNRNTLKKQVLPYEAASVPDTAYPDGLIAEKAINQLTHLADTKSPFFLAVGFYKPHLPFTAPKKYWDLYDRDSLPLSPNPSSPSGIHPNSLHNSGEMFGNYQLQPEKGGAGIQVSDSYAQTLRHGYFASVSYVDAQIGKVLDHIKRLGLSENTIIVIWGDHGWHLGDHTIWGKHSTFERALNSVLMIQTPDMPRQGEPSWATVESVDIYPTLVDLCQLHLPPGLSGKSLRPLLKNPKTPSIKPAISFWRNRLTIRNDHYRLIWYPSSEGQSVELFDHMSDPFETRNIADTHPEVVKQLTEQLSPYTLEN